MGADHHVLTGQRLNTIPWAVVELTVVIEIDLAGTAVEEEWQGERGAGFPREKGR